MCVCRALGLIVVLLQSFESHIRRRQLMNFVLVTTAGIPVLVALGCYLWYFVPPVAGGGGGAQLAGDVDGNPVTLEAWVKGHKDNDRELVQGLKGEPFYLISTPDNIKDFALLSGVHSPWLRRSMEQGRQQVLLPLPWLPVRRERQGGAWPCPTVLGLGSHHHH